MMKNRFFPILFSLLFLAPSLQAQYDAGKISKKAVESYNKALEKAQSDDLSGAIPLLEEAIRKDGRYIEAYLSLAGIHGQRKNHAQSVSFYEKAFAIDPEFTWEYQLPYSINLAGLGRFDDALAAINRLLQREQMNPNTIKAAQYRQKTYQFAVDFARNQPASGYVFTPVNLGEGVNSRESEYFPSLPITGKELVFTRRVNNFNEDFFSSVKEGAGWDAARKLAGNINTPQNEGAQIISQDGNWLVFTGCNRPDGLGSCDIYISYRTPEGWSEAMNLGNRVNSDQWESQPCLSPDKRDLYFTSRRPGGFGGSDVYVTHLQPNGRWSDPENLGPSINTPGDEACPFIHADNQTLYFTSNGLPGYGDEDLFMTRKGPNGAWSKPVNLGYPINTINREGTLFIAADGRTAYYASDRADSRGGLDIYSFEMRPDVQPYKTLWVRGQVFDSKTEKGLPSAVELIDLARNQVLSRVQTDENGNYLITLPTGKDYAFNVNRKGYLFYSDNYSLKDKSPDSTYEKNIPLQPIELNASVVLRNIFFDFNKAELKPESQSELDRVVQLLQDNPTVKIQIEGHTDNIGNAADNGKLSESRAKAVVAYLTGKGIGAGRLTFIGYGATKPIADNATEEGRAQNRRTGLKVVGK
ncbi:MAG TPA: OmpA family protein [Chitinophagaceae bacterium]|jgi:outer membrane protein OmpA-like peptidoglycan-associated protein/tetratricopeptide (TPR) repeat protein|nr:OmpA family protein [Chitinophagaceae bacterium]